MDVPSTPLQYAKLMTRVYLADAKLDERSALRLLLQDLNLELAGEASDWPTTLAKAPDSHVDMLLVDWELLLDSPNAALAELRQACPAALVIVLISQMDARQRAALSAGADAFISKGDTPERLAEYLHTFASNAAWRRHQNDDQRSSNSDATDDEASE